MIFVALGTCEPFPRLLARIDELAARMDVEFLVQYGKTEMPLPHCRSFDYAPSLEKYYAAARLVICHAGLGIQTELMRLGKPFIAIPRLARYHEHFDDHQVETCEYMAKRFGVRYILDMNDLTGELIGAYHYVVPYTGEALMQFRHHILRVIHEGK